MGNKSKFYAHIEVMHDEVTGSCILVSVTFPDGRKMRFIVDCGLYQEREYEKLNEELNINPDNIDFVLVTHNHVDHTGRLPLLTQKGYNGPIYMSDVTAKIISPALNDSYKVIKERCSNANKPLIYSIKDVYDVINQKIGVRFSKTISIGENVKVTFFKNGHLIGAALILVQISYKNVLDICEYEDINILFTGDYKKNNVFFDVDELPEWVKQLPLTIVSEATYGDTETRDIEYRFENNIEKAAKEERQIFVPAFSQGRFQEIMLFLKRMQEKGNLSKDMPIYLDGHLAIQYTNLFLKKELELREECKDFVPTNSFFVDDRMRLAILLNFDKKIIISTSGMASYGPARTYLPVLLRRKSALVHFTGYNAEGTMGRRVLECEKGEKVQIGGMEVVKQADVENTMEFSGHAKADELIDFLKQFENLKLVLINHGTFDAKQKFKDRVERDINPKNVEILDRSYYFRINAYGFMKKISTKK